MEKDSCAFGTDLSVHIEDGWVQAVSTDAIGTLLVGVREEEQLVNSITELRRESEEWWWSIPLIARHHVDWWVRTLISDMRSSEALEVAHFANKQREWRG